jgi:hypothetical protein
LLWSISLLSKPSRPSGLIRPPRPYHPENPISSHLAHAV